MTATVTAAAVQAAPVFLDRDATVDKVARLAKEAAADGAQLIAFPEAFVPTYPDWVWRTRPWADGPARWYERLLDQAVTVPGPTTAALGKTARDAGVYVSIGVNELAGATLYNTQLWFGPDGEVLGRHRKLMPTGGERLVWGYGDGSTVRVLDTPIGRLGGLICWENYMPLARYALYSEGIDVHVAPTWDNSDVWVSTMRHIAKVTTPAPTCSACTWTGPEAGGGRRSRGSCRVAWDAVHDNRVGNPYPARSGPTPAWRLGSGRAQGDFC